MTVGVSILIMRREKSLKTNLFNTKPHTLVHLNSIISQNEKTTNYLKLIKFSLSDMKLQAKYWDEVSIGM